jgi:phenylacetic acid degradation protein paaN
MFALHHNSTPPASIQSILEKHTNALLEAFEATLKRTFFEYYKENPKAYPETAQAEGLSRYEGQLNKSFDRLLQSYDSLSKSDETSPYTGQPLGITYPVYNNYETYVKRSAEALQTWRKVDFQTRSAILVEALDRIVNDFYEIAYATMHTTGQGFMMAFQASGPHANDRALEAMSVAFDEMKKVPTHVHWEKNMGKVMAQMDKYYRLVPKGVGLAIGCSTFPIWNSVPGIFASLVTGNTVIVKPHPLAVYPLAIVVARIQQVLADHGLNPEVCLLAVDTHENLLSKKLAEHPTVKVIDFTGSSEFGDYVENLPGKITFTEKAGVNSMIIDSTTDLTAMANNVAFSVALYSGQMCTRPQNFFIPKGGIVVNGEKVSYDEVVEAIIKAIQGLVTHPKAGHAVCGAIQNPNTYNRIQQAKTIKGKLLLDTHKVENPEFPNARTASPIVLEIPASDYHVYSHEAFGPIVYIIPTESTAHSVELAKKIATEKGAISCGAYTTDESIMRLIADEMTEAGTPVSFNLLGQIYVNQNSTFSDFHVSGANPAGNATFSDAAFVAKRFSIVGLRVSK